MDRNRIASVGITILHPTTRSTVNAPNDAELKADIVFIHGLNGHPKTTWTSKSSGIFWPLDLLAADIPDVRLMAFGYNANLFSDTSKGRISTYAENLLGEVFASRATEVERFRPLIFVCHSLGGQVVKRALCIASKRKEYKVLYGTTSGIVFLASPHRGSKMATYGDIARRIVSGLHPGAHSTESANELKAFSSTLQDINSDFRDIAEDYTIVSFFETQKTSNVGIIVPEWSATLDQPSERTKMAINADHRTICQFEGVQSESYQTVLRQLKLLVQEGRRSLATKLKNPLADSIADTPYSGSGRRQRSDETAGPSSESIYEPDLKRARAGNSLPKDDKETPGRGHLSPPNPELQYNRPHFNSNAYFSRAIPLGLVRNGLSSSKERSFAIYGLGGVGKTQLVLKYLHDYGHLYRQIFWVVADSDVKILAAFQDLASRLFPALNPPPSPEKSVQLVREWLSCNTDYLLVFDSADEPGILKPYWPVVGGSILVTSRGPLFVEQKIVASGFELSTLQPAEGALFLLNHISAAAAAAAAAADDEQECDQANPDTSGDAETISKRLGGQLLALAHMASWIRETNSTLPQFLKDYENEKYKNAITLDYRAPGATFNYERSYSTCWALSFAQLKEKSKPAAGLLGILAILDAESIPQELLEGYAKTAAEDIHTLANTVIYRLAIADLRRHGLMAMDPMRATIRIHKLVQEASVRHLSSTGGLQDAFEDATKCMSRVYPRQKQGCSMFESHRECRLWTPQLLSIERNYRAARSDPTRVRPIPLLAELLCHCGWYLYELDQTKAALETLATAKGICDDWYGDNPKPLTALICSNIGVIHAARHRPKQSLDISKLALKLRRICLPPDHPQIGESLNNCAGAYHDLGQLDEAQKLYEESVALQEKTALRNENLLEGAYSNLGRNLMAMKQYDKADIALEKATSFHEGFTGGPWFQSLTLFLIGNLRTYQGRLEEAEEEHRKALNMRLPALGPNHILVGVSYHQLARLLHRRGQEHGMDGAIQYLRNAIAIFEIERSEPGLVPRSKFVLGSVLAEVGKRTANKDILAESILLYKEAQQLVDSEPELAPLPCQSQDDWNMLVQYEYR